MFKAPEGSTEKTPQLDTKDKVLLGLVSGIGKYYQLDVSQLRVALAIVALFFFNFIFVLYVITYILIRLRIPFPKVDFEGKTSMNNMIGMTIILLGCGIVFNFAFPWLNASLLIALLLVVLGLHFIRHKQAR